MKKILFIVMLSFTMAGFADAQELGVRFGDTSSGNSFAIDGVFGAGKFSRIHTDVSFGHRSVEIDALWDFIYKPIGKEAFNWYVGAGPYIIFQDHFELGVAAEVGLEYKFKVVPISLSADWRPNVSLIEEANLYAGGFGINIRYVFGKK